MTILGIVLLVLIHQVLGSVPLKPSNPPKTLLKTSQNTQTFLLLNLKKRLSDLPNIRASKDKKAPKSKKAHTADKTLTELRERIVETVKDTDATFLFCEFIYELYTEYPKIDHVNQLYLDEEAGVERSLLHFAVLKDHSEVFETLIDHKVDPNLKDSNGYTALEMTFNEGLLDMTYKLIGHFPKCVSVPHFGY